MDTNQCKAAVEKMVSRVATITTLLDPDGIKLRFINLKGDGNFNDIQTTAQVGKIFKDEYFGFNGSHSRIGTQMRTKILEPLVFAKIEKKSLTRPLLITTITDGQVRIDPHSIQTQDGLKRDIAAW